MNRESTHKVLLIIADISGYTKLMVSSDIEIIHSQHIISELIQALIKEVEIPLEISKLEGDALFLYARKDSGIIPPDDIRRITGEKLIQFFEVFHEKLQELTSHTSCTCGACSNVLALRLKVVAHSGEALFYKIHQFNELSGTDVILVHRLLKNSEVTNEYLMLTEQAHMDIEFPCKLPVMEGSESYEHLGEIKTFIYNPYKISSH
jgi:hypothetical protein